ncbi:MAG: PIN domain-containing protein [Nevskiales bacterium]
MIVLDTNVISEAMRPEPHPGVLAWVAAQPRALLYTTHINQAEILYGIAALPEGRRRLHGQPDRPVGVIASEAKQSSASCAESRGNSTAVRHTAHSDEFGQ